MIPSSLEKLNIECIDEEDGGCTIQIEWNETDPDLQWWTDLGDKSQTKFITDALWDALECYMDDDLTSLVD